MSDLYGFFIFIHELSFIVYASLFIVFVKTVGSLGVNEDNTG